MKNLQRIHPTHDPEHAFVMLSTDAYSPGIWGDTPLTYRVFDDWPDWLSPLLAQADAARPYARMARHMPVEDFDGARVSSELISLVVEAHGCDTPLLWARGDVEYEGRTSAGAAAPCTPVFVWSHDGRLVAMCAPLDGSVIGPRAILDDSGRAALLKDVESAIAREAERFDEDIADAIVTAAGVAIDSLRSP